MAQPDIKIKFKVIELLSKTMQPRPQGSMFIEAFHFDIKADSQINLKEKLILILVDIGIREMDKQEILASFSIGCAFEIENFDEAVTKQNDNNYLILPELDTLMKQMSLSTARGIIFSEFRGTYLFNAVLPIIILPPSEIKK